MARGIRMSSLGDMLAKRIGWGAINTEGHGRATEERKEES